MSERLDWLRQRDWLLIILVLAAGVIVLFRIGAPAPAQDKPACTRVALPVVVNLDDVKHADLIAHERAAIRNGQPRQLTLERDGADRRRRDDLRGTPTRPGFDRDEWPIAASEEAGIHTDGRPRVDVAYVSSAENRSGGATLGAQLREFCDGQRFIVEAGKP